MCRVITDIGQITPEWLNEIMYKNARLTEGQVTDVAVSFKEGNSAYFAYLQLTYSNEVGLAPERLLLKMTKPLDWAREEAKQEVEFYQYIARQSDNLPFFVHCYDAQWHPDTLLSHILLDDLSESHYTPVTAQQAKQGNSVPSEQQLLAMVSCIAGFHAYWWEHQQLGSKLLPWAHWFRNEDTYRELMAKRTSELDYFLAQTTLPPDDLLAYQKCLTELKTSWPQIEQRIDHNRQLTLIHGDNYFSQYLCPHDPSAPTYIIDFGNRCVFLPAMDLVYMMATFWSPAQRLADNRERRLLDHYQNTLLKQGVDNYSHDQLMQDYILSLKLILFSTIWDMVSGASEAYWRRKLYCVTGALKDHCPELFVN